jgi:hypothetical protein
VEGIMKGWLEVKECEGILGIVGEEIKKHGYEGTKG